MKTPVTSLRMRVAVAAAFTVVPLACASNSSDSGFGSSDASSPNASSSTGGSSGSGSDSPSGSSGAGSGSSSGSSGAGPGSSSGSSGVSSSTSSGSRGGSSSGSSTSGSSSGSSGSSSGGSSGASSGASGSSSGSGTSSSSGSGGPGGSGPCDLYAAGGTPCVAAYSTVRSLSSAYSGPLYQVRAGGTTKDIGTLAGGFADAATQDSFCGTSTCTISVLYDQSGKGNNLTKAPAGCYTGTASQPDNESKATGRSLTVSGHKVYALYMIPQDGYRNNSATGMPTGTAAQGVYEVADGKRGGPACCWDFGNASTNNCNGPTGQMDTIFFGTGYWGKGAGSGPWFLGDFEAGVWAGGSGPSNTTNTSNPSMNVDYAMGVLKTNATNYAIRAGDAQQSGTLTTAYNGAPPAAWTLKGGIVLGIGGDNSNSSFGTFFEGAITAGRPTDATDDAVHANIVAAGYGK